MTDDEVQVMTSLAVQLGPALPLNNCHWDGWAIGKVAIYKMKRCVNCRYRAQAAQMLAAEGVLLNGSLYYGGVQDGVKWDWKRSFR